MAEDILTEEELDALLSAVQGGSVPAAAGEAGQDSRRVQPYDFRRPSRLSMDQTRTLQRLHDQVAELMGGSLSNYLGVSVDCALTALHEFSYELLLDSLPELLYVNVLSLAPLPQSGMLTLDQPLCLGLVDRLLGGQGDANDKRRPLTTIDQAIVDNVVEVCLRNLRESWSEFAKMELRTIERKTDCRLLQLLSPSETVVSICFHVAGQIEQGELRFVLPLQSLEPVLPRLSQQGALFRRQGGVDPDVRDQIDAIMQRVPMNIDTIIGGAEVSIGEMLTLMVGDSLRLDQTAKDPVQVLVDGEPKFHGKAGVSGRSKAVQILGCITED